MSACASEHVLVTGASGFIGRWLPRFARDRRAALTVAIGCTGGRHRSVYLAEQLAARLRPHHALIVRHRDIGRD